MVRLYRVTSPEAAVMTATELAEGQYLQLQRAETRD